MLNGMSVGSFADGMIFVKTKQSSLTIIKRCLALRVCAERNCRSGTRNRAYRLARSTRCGGPEISCVGSPRASTASARSRCMAWDAAWDRSSNRSANPETRTAGARTLVPGAGNRRSPGALIRLLTRRPILACRLSRGSLASLDYGTSNRLAVTSITSVGAAGLFGPSVARLEASTMRYTSRACRLPARMPDG
jgi:hypothetical protein